MWAMRTLSVLLSFFGVVTVGERCLSGMIDPAAKDNVDNPQCGVKVLRVYCRRWHGVVSVEGGEENRVLWS